MRTGTAATPAFSVLLPTRNRLDLAQGMVATLLAQDFGDWELIVADNASDQDVRGWCASLADPRITCIRSDVPLSVTDNWNRAMDASRGAHVVMMGDDDGLVPEYFEQIQALLARFRGVDLIYHGAWLFVFPGAHPRHPEGALTDATRMQKPLLARSDAEWLPASEAQALARAAFDMRCHFLFNMQNFLFSRRIIDRLRRFGPVFQGPFPDFYTATLALLQAERAVVVPRPMVVIGISKKSYGFHHIGGNEDAGAAFLGIDPVLADSRDPLAARLLPGSLMNTAWLLSVARAARHVGDVVNVARYRRLQVMKILQSPNPASAFGAMRSSLGWTERVLGRLFVLIAAGAARLQGRFGQRVLNGLHGRLARQYFEPPSSLELRHRQGGLADMRAVFACLEDGGPP